MNIYRCGGADLAVDLSSDLLLRLMPEVGLSCKFQYVQSQTINVPQCCNIFDGDGRGGYMFQLGYNAFQTAANVNRAFSEAFTYGPTVWR